MWFILFLTVYDQGIQHELILSPLVEIDQEDNVVPEAGHSMCGGHCDDERKEVVDEGVECLVHESAPEERKRKSRLFNLKLMRSYQGR